MGNTVTIENWARFILATGLVFATLPPIADLYNVSDDHPCRRPCQKGEPPKICEYEFEIEWYTTMSRACFSCPTDPEDCSRDQCILGSGSQRPVLVANRRLPGPSIEVCVGDRIQVKVINDLQNGEGTSIHWHGLRQRNSPFMDGVPMITQCPILQATDFTYDFEADVPGTYFWHGHSGVQRADGLAGALIIRSPDDPHAKLYDNDELPAVVMQDWLPTETAIYRFATHHYGDGTNKPVNILINGRWQIAPGDIIAPAELPPFPVPVSAFEYRLDAQLRYRFRVIGNAFLLCPISVTIEGHNLVVIASDGQPTKPQATRSLVVNPGERFDFVPYFTGEYYSSSAVYWLHAVGLADCLKNKARGMARITYINGTNPTRKTILLATGNQGSSIADEVNSVNLKTEWNKSETTEKGNITAVLLDSIRHDERIKREPDVSFTVAMDFYPVENRRLYPWRGVRGQRIFTPRLNNITNRLPPSPILTQPGDIPQDLFCNSTHRKCPADKYCECVHGLNVPVNALVEITLVDTGRVFGVATHPTHLHGYTFRLVGMDKVRSNYSVAEFLAADKAGNITRKFDYALEKDTITIPSGGYAIFRFVADNPGAWLLHCHIDYHMEIGMTLVLIVGNEIPRSLPTNFPKCGSWSPLENSHRPAKSLSTNLHTNTLSNYLVIYITLVHALYFYQQLFNYLFFSEMVKF